MSPIGVMHLVDTLEAGGAERMAVNLVNLLPRDRFRPYLCTTRHEGPLSPLVAQDVGRLQLSRRSCMDWNAIVHLVKFIREQNIRILHAHSTSVFTALVGQLFARPSSTVWHIHFGCYAGKPAPLAYRHAARRVNGVLAVSDSLAEWSRDRLHVPEHCVWHVPNFISPPQDFAPVPELPGLRGKRVVCVANLRPEKDHRTLIKAMSLVVQREHDAHLILVGATPDSACLHDLKSEIAARDLTGHVSLLGQRHDVLSILRACDIGVLSSKIEGLPLALIEYGCAGLACVATRVGQCPDVLDEGAAGIVVPPCSPELLAEAIEQLLRSPIQCSMLSKRLCKRVRALYDPEVVIQKVCCIYDVVLSRN